MTTESIINQIKLQSSIGIIEVYEGICEEYRRRLCEQWEIDFDESWWVLDRIGETLVIHRVHLYTLQMEDIRLMIDKNISFDDFLEWWENDAMNPEHPINARCWFVNGLRSNKL